MNIIMSLVAQAIHDTWEDNSGDEVIEERINRTLEEWGPGDTVLQIEGQLGLVSESEVKELIDDLGIDLNAVTVDFMLVEDEPVPKIHAPMDDVAKDLLKNLLASIFVDGWTLDAAMIRDIAYGLGETEEAISHAWHLRSFEFNNAEERVCINIHYVTASKNSWRFTVNFDSDGVATLTGQNI